MNLLYPLMMAVALANEGAEGAGEAAGGGGELRVGALVAAVDDRRAIGVGGSDRLVDLGQVEGHGR